MSTLKSESGYKSGDGSYSFVQDCKRHKFDSSSLDSVSDAKWWLNHHELGKKLSYDQLDVLEAEVKLFGQGNEKTKGENQLIEDYYTFHSKNTLAFCSHEKKSNQDGWLGDCKDMEALLFSNCANFMDLDASNCEREKKLSSDLDSNFAEPWWHAAENDDLGENRKPSLAEKGSYGGVRFSDQVKKEMANEEEQLSCITNSTGGRPVSLSDKSQGKMGIAERVAQGSDGTFSSSNGSNAPEPDSSDTQESTSSSDLSRTQLLEALCHSQTRAREAEKLAQEACDEKTQVIDLFFRQASYLFAYRQWLRMLQLETLCFQLRCKEFDSLTRSKGVVMRKTRRRGPPKKPCQNLCYVSTCALAFAVGLGLAGAGLIVGWTIGWLFPSF